METQLLDFVRLEPTSPPPEAFSRSFDIPACPIRYQHQHHSLYRKSARRHLVGYYKLLRTLDWFAGRTGCTTESSLQQRPAKQEHPRDNFLITSQAEISKSELLGAATLNRVVQILRNIVQAGRLTKLDVLPLMPVLLSWCLDCTCYTYLEN